MTYINAMDPRKPPMTYDDIKSHIASFLDANDVPTITPRYGILLAEAERALVGKDDPKQTKPDRGGRGGGVRGRGDRGAGRGGRGRGGQDRANNRSGDRGGDNREDRAGRFPGDLAKMKTKSGAPICVAFNKGRCEKEVTNGGCATSNGTRLHCCAVIIKLTPWQLCEEDHPAINCGNKI